MAIDLTKPDLNNWIKVLNTYDPQYYQPGKRVTAEEWNTLFLASVNQGNYISETIQILVDDHKNMNAIVNQADSNALQALEYANIAVTNSTQAMQASDTADSNANIALKNSNAALEQSDTAVQQSTVAKENATIALTNSETANSTSVQALSIANIASENATQAINKSNEAYTQSATALANSLIATEKVNTATDKSELAETNASDAKNQANTAVSVSNEAKSIAAIASSTATNASNTSAQALAKALEAVNNALSAVNLSTTAETNSQTAKETAQAAQKIASDTYDYVIETLQNAQADFAETDINSPNYIKNKPIIPSIEGLASENYVDTAVANLVNSAPETLDTLGELATAIENNADVVEALNSAIGNKVDKVIGKGLSTNDYTNEDKNKLAGLSNYNDSELRGLVNKLSTSKANQSDIPTNNNQLANGAGYITSDRAVGEGIRLRAKDSVHYDFYGDSVSSNAYVYINNPTGSNGWYKLLSPDGTLYSKNLEVAAKSDLDATNANVTANATAIKELQENPVSGGATILINGTPVNSVTFTSDPQTQLNNKVSTTTVAASMYGTDWDGKQTTYHIDMGDEITAWAVPVRGAGGTVACGDATRDMHAVNLGQLESKLSQKANLMSIRPNYVAVGNASGNGYPVDSSILITDLAKKDEVPKLYDSVGTNTDGAMTQRAVYENVYEVLDYNFGEALKEKANTVNTVTTNTNQTITARKDFTDAIYFHNTDKANYNATYRSMIYHYHDNLDFSASKESDGSGFFCFASFDIANKLFYVNGQKMANIGNVNTLSMRPTNIYTHVDIKGYKTGGSVVFTAPSNGFATIRGDYGSSYCVYHVNWSFYQWAGTGTGSPFFPLRTGDKIMLADNKSTINWADLYFVSTEQLS